MEVAVIGEFQGAGYVFSELKVNLVDRQACLHGLEHLGIGNQQKTIERHSGEPGVWNERAPR
jgi:hypothetical protein